MHYIFIDITNFWQYFKGSFANIKREYFDKVFIYALANPMTFITNLMFLNCFNINEIDYIFS